MSALFFFFICSKMIGNYFVFFFTSRRRHTRWTGDWSSDVCSSDLIEAGGKNGVIAPDQVTLDYVNARNTSGKPYRVVKPEAGAKYIFEKTYDVSKLEPVIAKPHSPDNKATVTEVKGTKLDRAYIGSCTGGKLTDFRAAANILKGKTVRIDTFVVPATTEVARGLKTEMIG